MTTVNGINRKLVHSYLLFSFAASVGLSYGRTKRNHRWNRSRLSDPQMRKGFIVPENEVYRRNRLHSALPKPHPFTAGGDPRTLSDRGTRTECAKLYEITWKLSSASTFWASNAPSPIRDVVRSGIDSRNARKVSSSTSAAFNGRF